MMPALSPELLEKMDAYWRAANYLSVGQIYLQDNPLLESLLERKHIKPRLLGHWGTTTGLNFIYIHLNRLINLAQQGKHTLGYHGADVATQSAAIPTTIQQLFDDAGSMGGLLQTATLRGQIARFLHKHKVDDLQ